MDKRTVLFGGLSIMVVFLCILFFGWWVWTASQGKQDFMKDMEPIERGLLYVAFAIGFHAIASNDKEIKVVIEDKRSK